MARIRTIKPEFFTHSKITKLTPLARLFYVSLWCEADRLGRMKWDAETLKNRYLPTDKCDVEALGAVLARAKLIRFYEIDGQTYIDIPGFLEHQVINNRESESTLPAFSDDACVTRESGVHDAAYGKEGRKGREGKEGTTPVVPTGTDSSESDFEKFWEAFPEKVGKKAAERAWTKAEDKPDLPSILASLERYIRSKPTDRAWCNPATWLNQGRWDDGAQAPEPPSDGIDPRWKARIENWKKTRAWLESQWGPPPDKPNCQAPKELLEARAA